MESGFSLKKSKPWKEERLGRALRSWIKIRSIGLIAWIFKNTHTDRCRSRYRCVYTHESSSHGHSEWPDLVSTYLAPLKGNRGPQIPQGVYRINRIRRCILPSV